MTASPNGNALLFTVSDPSPREADAAGVSTFAAQFPRFIVPPPTHGKLLNARSAVDSSS